MYHLYDSSDNELVEMINEGSAVAFEAAYRRYASQLYRYARKNIDLKEDCEEIIQDIFESLWKRCGKTRILNLRHYLFSAVKFKIIRYFQQHSVRRRYKEHFLAFELQYETTFFEEIQPEKVHEVIEQSIQSLPERCQLALRLRLYDNLSNTEIAQRMNISKKTVEIYMFKAFAQIRAQKDKLLSTS